MIDCHFPVYTLTFELSARKRLLYSEAEKEEKVCATVQEEQKGSSLFLTLTLSLLLRFGCM